MSAQRNRVALVCLLLICAFLGWRQSRLAEHLDPDDLCQRSRTGLAWETVHETSEQLRTAREIAPLLKKRASAWICLGEKQEAVKDLNRILALDDDQEARLYKGMLLERLLRQREARVEFELVASQTDPYWLPERTLALEFLDRKAEATESLKNSSTLNDDRLRRGVLLLDFNPMAAERELAQADHKDVASVRLHGYVLLQCRQYGAATVYYGRAADLERSARCSNYAWALYLNGNYDKALTYCSELPGREGLAVLDTRACIYLDSGRPDLALADLNRVLQNVTRNPYYYEQRAEAHLRLGQSSKAQADLCRAAQLRMQQSL